MSEMLGADGTRWLIYKSRPIVGEWCILPPAGFRERVIGNWFPTFEAARAAFAAGVRKTQCADLATGWR